MTKHKKLTRKQFEALFMGEWEKMRGDRYRMNGRFQTSIINGDKILRVGLHGEDRPFAVTAKSWTKLASSLQLERISQDHKFSSEEDE